MLELGPRARGVFALVYAGAQLAVLTFGLRAPDHVFGFQMFNESSRIRFELYRKVRGKRQLVPLIDDAWQYRDAAGQQHQARWGDRVRYRVLARSGVDMHASYGLEGQLFRLERALQDVLDQHPGDRRTEALVAVVHGTRNGHPQPALELRAVRR
jgi:hypothetical protein